MAKYCLLDSNNVPYKFFDDRLANLIPNYSIPSNAIKIDDSIANDLTSGKKVKKFDKAKNTFVDDDIEVIKELESSTISRNKYAMRNTKEAKGDFNFTFEDDNRKIKLNGIVPVYDYLGQTLPISINKSIDLNTGKNIFFMIDNNEIVNSSMPPHYGETTKPLLFRKRIMNINNKWYYHNGSDRLKQKDFYNDGTQLFKSDWGATSTNKIKEMTSNYSFKTYGKVDLNHHKDYPLPAPVLDMRSTSTTNVVVFDGVKISQKMTISVWFNPTNYKTDWTTLLSIGDKGTDNRLIIGVSSSRSSYSLRFQYNSKDKRNFIRNSHNILPKQWNHLAMVIDGDYQDIYLNGVRVSHQKWGKLDTRYSGKKGQIAMAIGGELDSYSYANPKLDRNQQFQGYVGNVDIIAKALNSDQIRELMNQQRAGYKSISRVGIITDTQKRNYVVANKDRKVSEYGYEPFTLPFGNMEKTVRTDKYDVMKSLSGGNVYSATPYAYVKGNYSYNKPYWGRWFAGFSADQRFFTIDGNDGFRIQKDGYYRVTYQQRGTKGVPYGGIGISGNRADILAENNRNGFANLWAHDHSVGISQWSKSMLIGFLPKGVLVTGGASRSNDSNWQMQYGYNGYHAFMTIEYLGDYHEVVNSFNYTQK